MLNFELSLCEIFMPDRRQQFMKQRVLASGRDCTVKTMHENLYFKIKAIDCANS